MRCAHVFLVYVSRAQRTLLAYHGGMATFRRSVVPGATYFFTVNTYRRIKVLTDPPFYLALKEALKRVMAIHPFEIDALCIATRSSSLHLDITAG